MRDPKSRTEDQTVAWVAWVMVIFLVGVVVLALLPDTLWNGRTPGGKVALTTAPDGVWLGATQGAPGEATLQALPVAGARTVQAQPGLMPFEQAPQVKFNGRIQQITEFQQRDGQIHVWLHDASGVEVQISVAPNWFLEYMGCTLTHDIQISGQGFRFDTQLQAGVSAPAGGAEPLIYAKKILVNGRNCGLRNDEGFALWSNRLR